MNEINDGSWLFDEISQTEEYENFISKNPDIEPWISVDELDGEENIDNKNELSISEERPYKKNLSELLKRMDNLERFTNIESVDVEIRDLFIQFNNEFSRSWDFTLSELYKYLLTISPEEDKHSVEQIMKILNKATDPLDTSQAYYIENFNDLGYLYHAFRGNYFNEMIVCFVKQDEEEYRLHIYDPKNSIMTSVKGIHKTDSDANIINSELFNGFRVSSTHSAEGSSLILSTESLDYNISNPDTYYTEVTVEVSKGGHTASCDYYITPGEDGSNISESS